MTTVWLHKRMIGRTLSRNNRRAKAGASLIEIMVVLVILLIGVFLAIQIFPIGLGTLAATDNRSRATRLARAYMGDVQDNASNLPQGVLFAYPRADSNGNTHLYPVASQDPDYLGVYSEAANNPDVNTFSANSPAVSDVNATEFIKGEAVKIPTAIPSASGGISSQYVLKYGPISLTAALGDPTTANSDPTYLNVVSAPLTAVSAMAGAPAAFATANGPTTGTTYTPLATDVVTTTAGIAGPLTFLLDVGSFGNSPLVMFAPGLSGQVVQLSYQYINIASPGSAPVSVTTTLTVSQPSGTPAWQGLPTGNGNAILPGGLVPGSLYVTCVFTRLANNPTPAWSATNPFQYALGSANLTSTTANPGILLFNPLGSTASQSSTTGQQAMTAYVDYAVLDWHIIHDDVQVPTVTASNNLIPVHLALGNLKRVGDVNPDNTVYNGIFDTAGDPNGSPDIEIVDLHSGTTYGTSGNLIHGTAGPALPNTTTAFYVDTDPRNGSYETGTIYVNQGMFPAGSQIRVLYKADGEWAVAMQKAFSSYTLTANTNTARPISGTANDEFGTYGIDRSGGDACLYFGRNDLNKSVTVSLQYTNSSGQLIRLPPAQYTIDNASGVYSYIDFGSTTGANSATLSATDRAGIIADPAWNVYGGIRGVSVKMRVIYKDNSNTKNNWRVQDVDTYLTQQSS